ncbi:MAG: hypothetical protein ACR65R_15160 [Methylomicrobium sp.]
MLANQIGVAGIATEEPFPIPKNLPQQRFAHSLEVDQVDRPADSGG